MFWIHVGGRFLEVITYDRWSHMTVGSTGVQAVAEPFAINFVL